MLMETLLYVWRFKLESNTDSKYNLVQGQETKVWDIKQYYIFEVTMEKSGSQTLNISYNDRSFAEKSRNIKYSSCRFILAKSLNYFDTQDGIQYIQGMYGHWERDYYIEQEYLEEGKYFVFVEIDWHDCL